MNEAAISLELIPGHIRVSIVCADSTHSVDIDPAGARQLAAALLEGAGQIVPVMGVVESAQTAHSAQE